MLTYDDFVDIYKPINNSIANKDYTFESNTFETYGEEEAFVYAQPDNLVWTEVDGDNGIYIIAGKHYVNRIHYYVCEVPFTNDNEEVVVEVYKDCGCFENDACVNCGGSGIISIYPDTQEELRELGLV